MFIALQESAEDDNLKTLLNPRRAGQGPVKQQKTAKTSEESCSTSDKKITRPNEAVSATQVSGSGPASLPQKPPNRRKISLKKSLQERTKSSETTHNKSHSYEIDPEHELLKVGVSNFIFLLGRIKNLLTYLLLFHFTGEGFDLSVTSTGTSKVHIRMVL